MQVICRQLVGFEVLLEKSEHGLYRLDLRGTESRPIESIRQETVRDVKTEKKIRNEHDVVVNQVLQLL